jgi:hypothetical protein
MKLRIAPTNESVLPPPPFVLTGGSEAARQLYDRCVMLRCTPEPLEGMGVLNTPSTRVRARADRLIPPNSPKLPRHQRPLPQPGALLALRALSRWAEQWLCTAKRSAAKSEAQHRKQRDGRSERSLAVSSLLILNSAKAITQKSVALSPPLF